MVKIGLIKNGEKKLTASSDQMILTDIYNK